MRKKIKVIFYILSFLFFYNWLIPVKLDIDKFWIKIIYISFFIPYIIYESIQLNNDNKKPIFLINRLYLTIIYSIILIFIIIYFK